MAEADTNAVGPAISAADAYRAEADRAATLNSNLADLIDMINKANGIGQDAVTTNAAYQQGLAESLA